MASVVSDSVWPYGLWPARLLCPWVSPGNNTRVHCHFLLQGIFPSQGSNPHLLFSCLGRWVLYYQHHQGRPSLSGPVQTGSSQAECLQEGWRPPALPAAGFGELQRGWERAGLLGWQSWLPQFSAPDTLTVSLLCMRTPWLGQAPSGVFVFAVIAHFNPKLFNAESKCSSQRKAQFLSSWRYTILAPGIISNKRQQIAMGWYFSSPEPFTVSDTL